MKNKFFKASGSILALIAIIIVVLAASAYVIWRVMKSDESLSASFLFAIVGLIFASRIFFNSWLGVLVNASAVFVFSLVTFLPGKRQANFIFENQIESWPYVFVFFFLLFVTTFRSNKKLHALSAEFLLLLSTATLYTSVDLLWLETTSRLIKISAIPFLAFPIYSIYVIFAGKPLFQKHKFALSIGSMIDLIFLALVNFYGMYVSFPDETATTDAFHKFFTGLSYFFFGVAITRFLHAVSVLLSFLPGKRTFLNSNYISKVKDLREAHSNRYTYKRNSGLYYAVFAGVAVLIFSVNFINLLMPAQILTWTLILIFGSNLFLNFGSKKKIRP